MCTAFGINLSDRFFGRNLDLCGHFEEQTVLTPRNFVWESRREGMQKTRYAMIGMASIEKNFPLYAEAVNEKGLGVAGLNFVGNAVFSDQSVNGKQNVATFELILWLLGSCASIEEAAKSLDLLHLTNDCFRSDLPPAALHWIISDGVRSLTLESTKKGMAVYENRCMTLTNNPPFPFQVAAWLKMPDCVEFRQELNFDRELDFCADTLGEECAVIPGGYTSTDRFLRTAWLLRHTKSAGSVDRDLAACFQILDTVAPIYGCVRETNGSTHYTVYSVCANLSKGIFYWKGAESPQVISIAFSDMDLNAAKLKTIDPYTLIRKH